MSSLISIIMPVFNAEKFVAEAIGSVLRQTYPHWELLVVNDGSTDGSAEIIKSFTDTRIRYLIQPNKGVSAARNRALQEMKGEFFCFLDADDVMPDESLQSRLKIFAADDDVHFVDGSVKIYDSDLANLLRQWRPSFKGNPFRMLIKLSDRCFFGLTWMVRVTPATAYKMDEALRHGEDLLFYIAIAGQGAYTYTPDCVLHYRRNPGSAMTNLTGLAHGYTLLRHKIIDLGGNRVSRASKVWLHIKTRKIMFLSFLSEWKLRLALRYLVMGSIDR